MRGEGGEEGGGESQQAEGGRGPVATWRHARAATLSARSVGGEGRRGEGRGRGGKGEGRASKLKEEEGLSLPGDTQGLQLCQRGQWEGRRGEGGVRGEGGEGRGRGEPAS